MYEFKNEAKPGVG